jgi:GTPase SAR1 family protein
MSENAIPLDDGAGSRKHCDRRAFRDSGGVDSDQSAGAAQFGKIRSWTSDLASVAAEFEIADVTDMCGEVESERRRTSFRVAVVGEFNRGKSTLINRLLDHEVMPTGPTARTDGLVLVRGSVSERIEVEGPNGRNTSLPLALASLSEVERGARVTMFANVSWLIEHNIELVDTAGGNKRHGGELEAARAAMRRADAAIVCVSAQKALSKTERQFLASEVLRRRVPHVVVALTMSDLVSADDLGEVLSWLKDELASLGSPEIAVLPGKEPQSAERLRHSIVLLAQQPGRVAARGQQVATVLLDAAELCEACAEAGQAVRRERVDAREQVLNQIRSKPPGTEKHWTELTNELQKRAHGVVVALREDVATWSKALVDQYLAELAVAADPLLWWKELLPVRAPRDVERLATQTSASLRTALERDITWAETAASQFGFHGKVPRAHVPALQASFEPPRASLTDTATRRRLAKFAGAAGAVVAAATAAIAGADPVIVFTSMGGLSGQVAGDGTVRRANRQNYEEARPLLVAALERSLEPLGRSCETLVPSFYEEVGRSMRDAARAMHVARIRTAEAELAAKEKPGPDWDQLAATAGRVATEIHIALQRAQPPGVWV